MKIDFMAIGNSGHDSSRTAKSKMLLALSIDPQRVSALATRAGLTESEAHDALQALQREQLAIADDQRYELTGPLSWFGDFTAAIAYYAKRNFVVAAKGEPLSHLYLCDVRIKNARPVGDPLTETVSVFACGKTARDVTLSAHHGAPICEDCVAALAR